MTLFEIVLMYALWFQAAGCAAPVGEAAGPVPGPVAQGEGRLGHRGQHQRQDRERNWRQERLRQRPLHQFASLTTCRDRSLS